METIQMILEKMNEFMIKKGESMQDLITNYIDVLSFFISNINEKHIA